MARSIVGSDFRLALELAALGMLGRIDVGFRSSERSIPGNDEIRTGAHFEKIERDAAAILAIVGNGDAASVVAAIKALDDETLQTLFARLVAAGIGARVRKTHDGDPIGAINLACAEAIPNPRALWTPDSRFFSRMDSADLRRIASSLLPGGRRKGIAEARKKDLVASLSAAFADAKTGNGMDAEEAAKLTRWLPGPLRFPAISESDRIVAERTENQRDELKTALWSD
jgi:hypothetical protein